MVALPEEIAKEFAGLPEIEQPRLKPRIKVTSADLGVSRGLEKVSIKRCNTCFVFTGKANTGKSSQQDDASQVRRKSNFLKFF